MEALRGDRTSQTIAAAHRGYPNQVSGLQRQAWDAWGSCLREELRWRQAVRRMMLERDYEVLSLSRQCDTTQVERFSPFSAVLQIWRVGGWR